MSRREHIELGHGSGRWVLLDATCPTPWQRLRRWLTRSAPTPPPAPRISVSRDRRDALSDAALSDIRAIDGHPMPRSKRRWMLVCPACEHVARFPTWRVAYDVALEHADWHRRYGVPPEAA